MIALHEIARTPTLLATKLRKLERQGRFSEALQDCLELVDGEARIPALEGASQRERAELLLRYGALIGFLGQNSQIANSQEQSKDLLTNALAEFIQLDDPIKVAECENYIAIAYWRLGELNEAMVWLDSSFGRDCPKVSEPRVAWYGIISLINIERKQFDENISLLKSVEQDFLALDDPYLTGIFYTNLGISLKDVGRSSEALRCFELVRHYHTRSQHRTYRGIAENNIALLYKNLGDFPRAHEAIDHAIRTFKKWKDKTREGFALDTKANIFLAERQLTSALRTIDRSLDILKRGENAAYRVESMLTRAKILLHLDRFTDAVFSLFEAVEIQRVKVGEDAARSLISEFEAELAMANPGSSPGASAASVRAEGLELLLPASLGNFQAYSAIRINNSHLEKFGIRSGCLAIVVDQAPVRGDLAAIEELRDGSVKCGVFDRDFGLVCLDRGDSEPELFNEDEVRVLGKVIGAANDIATIGGQLVVQPLNAGSSA